MKTSVVVIGAVGEIVFGAGRVRTVERVWIPREGRDVVMRIVVRVGVGDGALVVGAGRLTTVLKVSSPEAPGVVNTRVVVIGDVGNATAVLSVWRPADPDVVRRIVVTWLGLLLGGTPATAEVESGVGGSTIADENTGAATLVDGGTTGGTEETGAGEGKVTVSLISALDSVGCGNNAVVVVGGTETACAVT